MPRWELWTASQRRGLAAVLAVVIGILGIRLSMNRATVPDPLPALGPGAEQSADRLDPNTASAAELAAIPSLGEKRAAAIVAFREQFSADHPGLAAFNRPEDLQHVSGIGQATAEMMEPYLDFHQTASTQP